MAIRWTVIFGAAVLALATAKAQATDVAVVGLFPSKAVIVVNGAAPRTISIGQRLTEGVVLVAVTNETATLEIDGVPRTLRMGQHFAASRAAVDRAVGKKMPAGTPKLQPENPR